MTFKKGEYLVELLDLSPMVLEEIAQRYKSYRAQYREIYDELPKHRTKHFRIDDELLKRYRENEERYSKQVAEILGPEKWKKLTGCSQRAAFFCSSTDHYLSHDFVNAGKKVTKQQLEKYYASRGDRVAWLKKKINYLYFSAFDILIEPLNSRQKKTLKQMLAQKQDFFLRSPSTMYYFARNGRPEILPIDRKLGLYYSHWNPSPVSGQLDFSFLESYGSAYSNMMRDYWFFRTHIANEEEKKAIKKMIDYLGLMFLINDSFRERDKNGKVPLVDYLNKQFRVVQEAGGSDRFNQFVFANQLANIGLIASLESGTVFDIDIASPIDIENIKKQSKKASEFLVVESNKILEEYLDTHLKMFSAKLRRRLHDILFFLEESERTMIPLELLYLNTLIEGKDRNVIKRSGTRWEYGLKTPDAEYWTDPSGGKDLRPSIWEDKQ